MSGENLRTVIGMILAVGDEDEDRFMELLLKCPAEPVAVATLLHQMAAFAAALVPREQIAAAALEFAR